MERKPPQDSDSRHADKYIVRFPDGMRDRLKAQARINNRTLNAEIVARLHQTLEGEVRANVVSRTTFEEATPEELAEMRRINQAGIHLTRDEIETMVEKAASAAAESAVRQVVGPVGGFSAMKLGTPSALAVPPAEIVKKAKK